MSTLRILVTNDHEAVRKGLRRDHAHSGFWRLPNCVTPQPVLLSPQSPANPDEYWQRIRDSNPSDWLRDPCVYAGLRAMAFFVCDL